MIKKNVIKCPHCGCEYLPAEVFYPKYLLGKPFNIIRDEEGTILMQLKGNDITFENFKTETNG